MIILQNGNLMDFDTPIWVPAEKREEFISFMRELLDNDLDIVEVIEKDKEVGEREVSQKKWTAKDIKELLSTETEEELANKLGRTRMSVRMARGYMVADIVSWAKKHGRDLPIDEQTIEEYLREVKR